MCCLSLTPYLCCQTPLTPPPNQGFVFLPKTACEVREVEFARALRLGQSSLEPVAFHVPRVKVGGRGGWLCFGRGTGGRAPP